MSLWTSVMVAAAMIQPAMVQPATEAKFGGLRNERRARLSFAVGRDHVGFAVTGRF